MIKVDLITGILGSGKTTFIRKYAEYLIKKGEKIAILENDFGAVNIDMVMLQDLKCENCQLEMISGGGDSDCHKRRFKTQMISLGMQKFDRVIIEPSGIFDMDEFFDTLYESPLDRWFQIGNILTIIDAGVADKLSDQMEYLFASEASCSGKLVISKISELGKDVSIEERIENILTHLNSSLENIKCSRQFAKKDVFCAEWNDMKDEDYEILLSAGYRGESYVKLYTNEDIKSGVHYFMHIKIKDEYLLTVIKDIIDDKECGKIFRIKGSVQNDAGNWLKINGTPEKIDVDPVADGQSVFIVIGDNLNIEKINEHFKKHNTDKEFVSI